VFDLRDVSLRHRIQAACVGGVGTLPRIFMVTDDNALITSSVEVKNVWSYTAIPSYHQGNQNGCVMVNVRQYFVRTNWQFFSVKL
jgi:hypothetical protein